MPEDAEKSYKLTQEELRWMLSLSTSTAKVREMLLAHDAPADNVLYDLINRADALLWHLAKRDELPEDLKRLIEERIG